MPSTEVETKLDRAHARRENLFRRAQLCLDAGKALKNDPEDNNKLETFEIRYSTFDKTILEYHEVVQNIVMLKQELKPNEAPSYTILDSFSEINDHIQYLARKLLNNSQIRVPSGQNENVKTRIHMPKLEIMKFSGEDLAIWPLFYENFKQLVHLKSEFSKAEKMQYLLGSLTGRALKTCTSIEAVPDNYDALFKLLEDTYHDEKFLANMYLDRLINFRAIVNNSPSNLQMFLEKFDTNVSALKRLKVDSLEDYILTYLAMSKLSAETINSFELVRNNSDIPKYEDLINFIKRQSKILCKTEKGRPNPGIGANLHNVSYKNSKSFIANNSESTVNRNCIFCNKGMHLLKDCYSFKSSNFETKFKFIKERNLCLNCFSSKHKAYFCPSKYTCLKCKSKHHTYLHKEVEISNPIDNSKINSLPSTSEVSTNELDATQSFCSQIVEKNKPNVILLSTALVKTYDRWGKQHLLRFLVDNASMSNLLTVDSCKKLGLSYSKLSSNVQGIGGTVKPLRGRTSLNIFSNINPNLKYSIEVLLIDRVTNLLPDVPPDIKSLDYLKYLPLADPTFHIPGKIDGILGASMFVEILGTHKVTGKSGSPTAVQSALGYLIIGPSNLLENQVQTKSYCTFLTLDTLVEKMFEIEDYTDHPASSEDEICENLFVGSVSRDNTGRYTVGLPFKDDPSQIGNSFDIAQKRLFSLERRLENSPNLRLIYSDILQDYLKQGHMSLVPNEKLDVPSYYAAHHCVWKPDSPTTPCRIVFDFSMKSDNGISLNEILYKGPKLQNHMFTILLNFRLYPICLGADIKAMYRQINIVEAQRPYQRILWRFNKKDQISVYQLNTVTFGVTSSPFLSLRIVKQLIQDESDLFPEVIEYVQRDMFMDDLLVSLPNIDIAIKLQPQLVEFFKAGSFEMVKWISNSVKVLSHIPIEMQSPTVVEFDKSYFKVLGLQYTPSSDDFNFKIQEINGICTKRTMLSVVSRIFDPLGFLSPISLFIKLLIKKLWEIKWDWDDPAPKEIKMLWEKFENEFSLLNNTKIPRHVRVSENSSYSIIGFSDASPSGYASVVYIRAVDTSGSVNVTFLCSQARVAPMTKITLPRLELCAATQLAKLISHVRDTYSNRKSIENIFAFSDSMITLHWIHSTPKKWKTFISHRISKIQDCLSSSHWYFVPGKQNVSDCASRGLLPSALVNHPTWFEGPKWLLLPPADWPVKSFNRNIDCEDVSQEILVHLVTKEVVSSLYSLIEYFSSWSKLLHSTVYVLRFVRLLPIQDHISKLDLNKAERYLIRAVQKRHFNEEYKLLSTNRQVRSNIRRLNPFIQDGIIRVGGRISRAKINFDQRHPILLPKSDPFVILLIEYYHKLYCHTGAHLLQSILSQQFWILSVRDVIRKCIWKCNLCFRFHPKPSFPMMSDLPYERVNQAKAFLNTGVDYTGSYQITLSRHRGVRSQKAYICLFVCLATRAVHLELAADLSTECFLAALKRFLSRRGNCTTIFSDNATNFVGAKAQIDEMYTMVMSKEYRDEFQRELNIRKIEWKFNPPLSPHMGGIWEANIKSVKTHLNKIIKDQILTYEEFNTILTQIEALLNSRPLCSLSSDPNDLTPLTPAHFLYGSPLNSLPAVDLSSEPYNRLTRYKLLDAMITHFWNRWRREYLSSLQMRQKWNTGSNPPKLGMIVIIIQDNIPPLQWPLAIIESLHPGADGIVRVATVKTRSGSYLRPIVKLCPLPRQ